MGFWWTGWGNRLGFDRVGRFEPRESHIPENAVVFIPAVAGIRPLEEDREPHDWRVEERQRVGRPLRMLPCAEPVETIAEVPDGPPRQFRWRRVTYHVARSEGPERIAPEWWRHRSASQGRAHVRDYYRVEDEQGRRFWLYRDGLFGSRDGTSEMVCAWGVRMSASVYTLRCSDGAYYVGLTRLSVEKRVAEHNAGKFGGYTASRRPVSLVFSETFERITDAISVERQLKGWSRAKKEALIAGDFALLKSLSKRGASLSQPHAEERALARVSKQGGDNASFETRSSTSPQDEGGGFSRGEESSS